MDELQIKSYHEKVESNIKEFGYHITYVQAKDDFPSFCYSTGIFKNFNIPEIIVSSLGPNLSSELITNYVNSFKNRAEIVINKKLDFLTERFPVYLIEVPNSKLENYVLSSFKFYKNNEFRYLQIIYPDTEGHFPNEVGYDYDQEIFGKFTSEPN